MSGKNTSGSGVIREGEVIPCPPPKIDLRNAEAIRREMAAVYRDMRSGKIETQDGTRLVYVLTALRQAYETDILERRVQDLERRTAYVEIGQAA